MKIYRIPFVLYATAYIKAENEDEACDKAKDFQDTWFEDTQGTLFSGKGSDHPDTPEISLSPAMMVGEPALDYIEEG